MTFSDMKQYHGARMCRRGADSGSARMRTVRTNRTEENAMMTKRDWTPPTVTEETVGLEVTS